MSLTSTVPLYQVILTDGYGRTRGTHQITQVKRHIECVEISSSSDEETAECLAMDVDGQDNEPSDSCRLTPPNSNPPSSPIDNRAEEQVSRVHTRRSKKHCREKPHSRLQSGNDKGASKPKSKQKDPKSSAIPNDENGKRSRHKSSTSTVNPVNASTDRSIPASKLNPGGKSSKSRRHEVGPTTIVGHVDTEVYKPAIELTMEEYMERLGVNFKSCVPKMPQKQPLKGIDKLTIDLRNHLILADNKQTRKIKITRTIKREFPRSAMIDLTSLRGKEILSKIPGAIVDPLKTQLFNVERNGYAGQNWWPTGDLRRKVMKKRHSEMDISAIKEPAPAKEEPQYYRYLWQEKLPRERKRRDDNRIAAQEAKEEEKVTKELRKRELEAKQKVIEAENEAKNEANKRKQILDCKKYPSFVNMGRAIPIAECRFCESIMVPGLHKRCPACDRI